MRKTVLGGGRKYENSGTQYGTNSLPADVAVGLSAFGEDGKPFLAADPETFAQFISPARPCGDGQESGMMLAGLSALREHVRRTLR